MKGTGKTFSCSWSLIYRLFVPLGGTLCMCGYFITVAHNCHGKFKFTAKNSNSPQQIQIHCGKFKFTTANSNSLRQIQIYCGKFKFTTANSNSLRQIQIYCSKFKFHPIQRQFSTVEAFSTLEVVQYIGGITPVLWGIASVLWSLLIILGISFSTVGG